MIQSEKELEDYICANQEEFIKALKNIYGNDKGIEFIGRQVKLGEDNITDLLYYFDEKNSKLLWEVKERRSFIIVELKFRQLEVKDLAQLQRYMNVLSNKLNENKYSEMDYNIYGVFISFGLTKEMQNINMANNINDISFISIRNKIEYCIDNWKFNEEYLKNINLDDRIEELYVLREANNGGIPNQ